MSSEERGAINNDSDVIDVDFDKLRREINDHFNERNKSNDERKFAQQRLTPLEVVSNANPQVAAAAVDGFGGASTAARTEDPLGNFSFKRGTVSIFSSASLKYTLVLSIFCFIVNFFLTVAIFGLSKGWLAPILLNVCTMATFDLTYRYQREMYEKIVSKFKNIYLKMN